MNILIDTTVFEYTVERSRRKTICLRLNGNCRFTVKAPLRLAASRITDFIAGRAAWIKKHDQLLTERANRTPLRLTDGSPAVYRGGDYTLRLIQSDRTAITVNNAEIIVAAPGDWLNALYVWYRREAAALIEPLAERWAARLDVNVNRLTVRNQRTRWGSCSGRHNVNYNWRLILLPPDVCEYVVIHELAHCRHLNHSPQFWLTVAEYCPDYRRQKSWLNANSAAIFAFTEALTAAYL